MKKIFYFVIALQILFIVVNLYSFTNKKKPEVGIEERTGEKIPLNLQFNNSDGKIFTLEQIIDRPVVISLVYYHCPGICTPLLTSLAQTVDRIKLKPGKDFKVITISFDHTETIETAQKWKDSYLESISRNDISHNDWYFMTGDSTNIYKLTEALGFNFKSDGAKDFIHAGSIYVIAKNGKIARYLFGTEFLPADLKMAILEAKKEMSSPTINKILAMCYSYDPEGQTYKLNVTRIAGSVMLLGVFVFLGVLLFKKGKGRRVN